MKKQFLILMFFIVGLSFLGETAYQATSSLSLTPAVQKKDYTVYITNTGERYHRGSCRYLSRSKIAIKKSDAVKQGYTPCKVCRP
jgi:hypothetical protein